MVAGEELDSYVNVVHRCFTEVSDSILGAFFCEPLRTKLQDKQQVSDWMSHMICPDVHEIKSCPCIWLNPQVQIYVTGIHHR